MVRHSLQPRLPVTQSTIRPFTSWFSTPTRSTCYRPIAWAQSDSNQLFSPRLFGCTVRPLWCFTLIQPLCARERLAQLTHTPFLSMCLSDYATARCLSGTVGTYKIDVLCNMSKNLQRFTVVAVLISARMTLPPRVSLSQ